MTEIDCRFCQRRVDVKHGVCLGCGSYAANAREHKRKRQAPRCPKCKGHRVNAFDGCLMCRDCGCQFEALDFGFADTRPDVNAMKKGL